MPLEPQIAALLENIAEQNVPALNDLPVDEARAMVIAGIPDLPEVPVAGVEDCVIDGSRFAPDGQHVGDIPIRIYYPAIDQENSDQINSDQEASKQKHSTQKPPVHVYFHGGGWVLSNLDTHDEVCRELCSGAGIIVVSVDYRLAPEHPFPAGLNDAFAAVCWVSENLAELGARQDETAMSVGGDSAGANLAAAVCMMARDASNHHPKPQKILFQLLCYPITDASMSSQSYSESAEGYILTKAMMAWFWHCYCSESTLRSHPFASVLEAPDLSELPAALVLTAEYDPLRDEGEAYAVRLKNAGVAVEAKRFNGLIHGFMSQAGYIPAARAGLELAVNALKRAHS